MAYSDAQIDNLLNQFPNWAYDPDRRQVITGLQFNDFTEAMVFVNAVGEIANALNHHPNILLHDFNNVQIASTTHEEEGLSDKDAQLLTEIEALIAGSERKQSLIPVQEAPVRQVGTPSAQPVPVQTPATPQIPPQTSPVEPITPPAPVQPVMPGSQAITPGASPNLAGPSATNVSSGGAPVANG